MEPPCASGVDDARALFIPAILTKRNFWVVDDDALLTRVQQAYAYHRNVERELLSGDQLSMDAPLIPHILHFIWLGSSTPDWVQHNIDSWREHHPGWEIWVWSDAEAETFTLANRQAFNAAANFGEKSDILRYEVLHRHGGCYVDCDMECVGCLEHLHSTTTMFCGVSNTSAFEINNALIGCAAGHLVMADIISIISQQQQQRELAKHASVVANIAGFLGAATPQQGLANGMLAFDTATVLQRPSHSDTIAFSGPGMFTRAISRALARQIEETNIPTTASGMASLQHGAQLSHLVVLPPSVFYPIPNSEPILNSAPDRYRQLLHQHVGPDTIAVHQWACSWQR